ncbi:PHB depolymerase family esterase [Xenophilus arseniciresistens]|uniref:PHB depolymerase family esterase n=1 Tax=Xenophilus arseniciresistens TaxID=1283306 RepID=A0AAE3N8I2_9BURK|nr:PHB depolymerase family esterase [Xenophilus arseniciresistens]MDA7416291.1 PHB depolymerase family esterase [Xenophilus arseniciresistens]
MPRSRKASPFSALKPLASLYQRQLKVLSKAGERSTRKAGEAVRKAARGSAGRPPPGPGDWLQGLALGPAGPRRFYVYRPPGLRPPAGQRLPLLLMLHGCGQDARDFAVGTRMNRIAARMGFLVLYAEQDRVAHAQGCWNWFATRSGRAQGEALTLLSAVDQACQFYGADPARVAVAGLSAGAGMAAFLASQWPSRFCAVAMHSGVGPGAASSTATALQAMQGLRAPQVRPPHASVAPALPPLLVLQGDSDRVVDMRNALALCQAWAQASGATIGAPQLRQRGQRRAMLWQDWRLRRQLRVRCITVQGLGHAWSGGSARGSFTDPQGPDGSALVAAFVRTAWGAAARIAA